MKARVLLGAAVCLFVTSYATASKETGWIKGGEFPKVKIIVEHTASYDGRSAESIFANCLEALDDLGIVRWEANKDLGRIHATQYDSRSETEFRTLISEHEKATEKLDDTRKENDVPRYYFLIVSEQEGKTFLSIRIAEPGKPGGKVNGGEIPLKRFLLALEKRMTTDVAADQDVEKESFTAFLEEGQRLRLSVHRWTTAEEMQNLRQVYDEGGWAALKKEMQKTVVGYAFSPFFGDKPLEDRQSIHMASYRQTEKGRRVQLVTWRYDKSLISVEFILDEQGTGKGMLHMGDIAHIRPDMAFFNIDVEARTSYTLLRVRKMK